MWVKQRRIALNKALSFQTSHALKARRWRKSDAFRKLYVGNSPILLQFVQNIAVDAVEIFAWALFTIYHYYCLSVFLPYSRLGSAHVIVQSLCPRPVLSI